MSSFELLICVALVLVSGFMSASEVALFSLSRFQLRSLKERFRPAHRKMKRLLADPGGLLITTLVFNEMLNIALSTLIAKAVSESWASPDSPFQWIQSRLFGGAPDWAVQAVVGTVITAPIILFLCEITPKVIAARANMMVSALTVGPLTWLYEGSRPIRFVIKRFMSLVSRALGTHSAPVADDGQPLLREKEFLFMVEEGHREGAIHESEMGLIRNVFELDDTRVEDVYTPISQVYSLPSTMSHKAALTALKAQNYSRVPVTGTNRKQVVGVLYSKDLLFTKLADRDRHDSATVASMMRKPFTVNLDLKLNVLFRRMKQQKTHLAVVESRPGEAIGIVTMDDLLDALFEDILLDEGEGA
jgi:putative hemolysin